MKISFESKDSTNRSVTVEFSDHIDMHELAEIFAGACVTIGFHPQSVKKYVYSEMLDGTFKGDEA